MSLPHSCPGASKGESLRDTLLKWTKLFLAKKVLPHMEGDDESILAGVRVGDFVRASVSAVERAAGHDVVEAKCVEALLGQAFRKPFDKVYQRPRFWLVG